METAIEEVTPGTESFLVYEHQSEIQRITAELTNRLNILNKLNTAGLGQDEIKTITSSQSAIDKYIFDLQLKGNKKLRELQASGIHVPADLPAELQELKYTLSAWFNYRMAYSGSNKFSGLFHDGEVWQIDTNQLERHFEAKGLKVFVQDEALKEYQDYQTLCEILNKRGMYHGQVRDSPWLNARIENTFNGFIVRGSYFRNRT
ncbi:MAG: hypothetical protein WAZ98_00210 [Cyclobacteriaceae bacterium]